MTLYDSIGLCMTVYDCVRLGLCMTIYDYMDLGVSMSVHDSFVCKVSSALEGLSEGPLSIS